MIKVEVLCCRNHTAGNHQQNVNNGSAEVKKTHVDSVDLICRRKMRVDREKKRQK